MQPVMLDKSWHLWVANFGEKRIDPECGTDICEYTRAFLSGLFWLVVTTCMLTGLASWVGFSIYDLGCWMFGDADHKLLPYTYIMLISIAVLALIVLYAWVKVELQNRPVKPGAPKKPSFAGLAYRKFKDKTCFRIKFNE